MTNERTLLTGLNIYEVTIVILGASDDAVTCCLMLEVLNVLTRNDTTFPHSIIFIFNGAEENILQVLCRQRYWIVIYHGSGLS